MTAAVLDRPAAAVEPTTLEQAVARAWGALGSHRAADCLVCGGTLAPCYGASGSAPVAGRCADCGSTLG